MKVAKIKKTEVKKKAIVVEENDFTIKKLVGTIVSILWAIALFYGITVLVVKPLVESPKKGIVEIDTTKITMNQVLTRKESEYYVLAVKESEYINLYTNLNYFELYNNAINKYKENEDSLNFYWVDMDDAFNGAHWGEEVDIDNLIINDDTLFKVSDGRISNYYVGHEDILEALQNL